jgi:hypothetical protein
MQRVVVIPYRRFSTTYMCRLQASRIHLAIMFKFMATEDFASVLEKDENPLSTGFPGKFLIVHHVVILSK